MIRNPFDNIPISTIKPDQRVSSSYKQNPKWYIENANFIIDLALTSDDKNITRRFLDAANGLVDKKTYDYVLKSFKIGDLDIEDYAQIREVDFLTPIKERYMGEFINQYSNYQIYNADPQVVLARNKELAHRMGVWLSQEIVNRLNAAGMQTGRESVTQEDIEKIKEEVLENYIDDVIESANKRLGLVNMLNRAKDVYQQAYFYWWATESVFTYRENYRGDTHFQAVSPLEYYRVDSGNRFVEDDDYGVRLYKMTVSDLIDRFRDELKPKEIKYLQNLYASGTDFNTVDTMQWIRQLDDFAERQAVLATRQDVLNQVKVYNDSVDVFHYVWKTEVKQGILTYITPSGEISQTIVDEDYKLDPLNGDLDIEWEWVNQVWEGWRFGGRHEGVYLKPRPIEVQRENINNNSECKLPYNGIVGLIKENLRNPIPFRLLPYLALYRIFTLQQERAVAKYKSYLIFPESLLGDSNAMTTAQRLAAANKDTLFPVDDADANPTALQHIREVATGALNNLINTLESLKQNIKAEAWEISNMNAARLGDVKDYAGKAVTESNYANAIAGSVWGLEVFNTFRERDYLANLDYTKYAWINGKQASYIDPTTGKLVVVDLDGESDFSSALGIDIVNSAETRRQLEEMRQLAFSAAQNGEFSVAVDAITQNNTRIIAKSIKEAQQATREFQAQMEAAKSQQQAEIQRMQSEQRMAELQYEAEQKQADRDNAIELQRMKIEADKELMAMKLQVDADGNGVITQQEMALHNAGLTTEQVRAIQMRNAIEQSR